jgi:hypothetical protein
MMFWRLLFLFLFISSISEDVCGQNSLQKISLLDAVKCPHGNGRFDFSQDLNFFLQNPGDADIDTRVIIFIDSTLNNDGDAQKKTTKLLQAFLENKETNVKTVVYLCLVPNDVLWSDLSIVDPPLEKPGKQKSKSGRLITHLSALVLSNSPSELRERCEHFAREASATREHTTRYYVSSKLNKEFLFVEKAKYGASCIVNEDSLLIKALSTMWNKDLVLKQAANKCEYELGKISKDFSDLDSLMDHYQDSLNRGEPKTPWQIMMNNYFHFGLSMNTSLPNKELSLKGSLYSSGLSVGYIYRKYGFYLGVSSFSGRVESADKLDFTNTIVSDRYTQISRVGSYHESIDLSGIRLSASCDWHPIYQLPQLALFGGITLNSLRSASYKANAAVWSISRKYDNYSVEITDIPELGLVADSTIDIAGSMSLKSAWSIPVGVSYSFKMSSRWGVGGFFARNFAVRNWITERLDGTPYDAINIKGSLVQWSYSLPVIPWEAGISIIYDL